MLRQASTVSEYLGQLTPDERADLGKVRSVIRRNLPKGFKEAVNYGMICYQVPLSRYPDTYNGQPLCYAALAAHKNYRSVYLMTAYGSAEQEQKFKKRWLAAGKKLNMGKSCIRFTSADELALDVIGNTIARTGVDDYIAMYEAAQRKRPKSAKKKAAKR